jgi:predicted AAA+ superfamily ATPase
MKLPILQKISVQILSKETPEYKRWLFDKIDFSSKLIGIKGPRGSGKSTLLLQYAKSTALPSSKILFIHCDHPAVVHPLLASSRHYRPLSFIPSYHAKTLFTH